MAIENALETLNYLQHLPCSSDIIEHAQPGVEVLQGLLHALQQDGYDIVRRAAEHRQTDATSITSAIGQVLGAREGLVNEQQGQYYLRRLSEIGGSSMIADLLLVAMCVIFAGFASGLTQVSYKSSW
jgi:hypothetical protein